MPRSLSKASLAPGTVIGDYQLEAVCYVGAHATIYRAAHVRLPRRAAIKVLSQCWEQNSSEAARFRQVSGQLSTIRHPSVAEVYDFGLLDDGAPYLVLAWIEGVALGGAEEPQVPASVEQTLKQMKAIASGLGEVHLAKLAHCGIRCSNVLIDSETGKPILIGFDARAAAEAASTGETLSIEDDLRDLGALIQQCDWDQASAAGKEASVTMATALAGGSTEISEIVESVIRRCRPASGDKGYDSAAAVVRDLDRALKLLGKDSEVLPIGTVVGDSYRVTAVIGEGGMGLVYEAVHVRLPQRVAIKVISGSFSEESLIRFRREAEIASSLGHPHIVRVIDFNTMDDGKPYMVMEFLKGEDLGKVLRRGPIALERALRITSQIGSALAVAHESGIVHRDLKPPNVYLRKVDIGGEEREHATVLDFGVSKREGAGTSVTGTLAVIGTPQYMAPEQAMGRNDEVNAKSDQFALGCLVYEMLSGRPAFGRGELAEVVYRVCHQDAAPLDSVVSGVTPTVAEAVSRAMSKDADDRFDSVVDFVAALTGRQGESASTTGANDAAPASTSRVEAPTDRAELATVVNRPTARPDAGARGTSSIKTDASDSPDQAQVPEDRNTVHRGRTALLVGAGLVALAGAAVLFYPGSSDSPVADEAQSVATALESDGAPVVTAAAPRLQGGAGPEDAGVSDAGVSDAEGDDAEGDGADAGAGAGATADGGASSTPSGNASKHKPSSVASEISPRVRAKLDAAQSLLKSGKYREARNALGRDKEVSKTNEAMALSVMSFCGEGRFGPAKDWFSRLARGDRKRVRSYCKDVHDIDL